MKILLFFLFIFGIHSVSKNPYQEFWDLNKDIITKSVGAYLDNLEEVYEISYKGNITFFDLDHTLVDTRYEIPIRDSKNKIIKYVDSKCIPTIGKDESYDYSVFTRENLYQSNPINQVLDILKKNKKDHSTFIITARSMSHNFTSIREYLAKYDAEPDGIFPIHSEYWEKNLFHKMILPNSWKKIPSGLKKPIIMSGIIHYLEKSGIEVRNITFYEDTDSYLNEAFKFLPEVFPNMSFQFYDVIRIWNENETIYQLQKVGFPKEDIYSSKDCNNL